MGYKDGGLGEEERPEVVVGQNGFIRGPFSLGRSRIFRELFFAGEVQRRVSLWPCFVGMLSHFK